MSNCAIHLKGSDKIRFFIRDAVQTGRDFKGSNCSVTGVKEHLFDVVWTDDHVEPIIDSGGKQSGHNKTVSELSPARRYEGRVVSTPEDVNRVTRDLIAARYSASDEIKILRMKLAGDETGWKDYQEYVDGLVKAGREFKEKEFGK